MSFIWTDENTAEAGRLYLEGKSCSEIAILIGAISRNSVISRLHRKHVITPEQAAARKFDGAATLRLAERRVTARKPKPVVPPANKRKAVVRAAIVNGEAIPPYVAVKTPPAEIAIAPRHWITRQLFECAFPVSGEGYETASCCNRTFGLTYCPAHQRLMRLKVKSHQTPTGLMRSVRWAA